MAVGSLWYMHGGIVSMTRNLTGRGAVSVEVTMIAVVRKNPIAAGCSSYLIAVVRFCRTTGTFFAQTRRKVLCNWANPDCSIPDARAPLCNWANPDYSSRCRQTGLHPRWRSARGKLCSPVLPVMERLLVRVNQEKRLSPKGTAFLAICIQILPHQGKIVHAAWLAAKVFQ